MVAEEDEYPKGSNHKTEIAQTRHRQQEVQLPP